MIRSMTGFGESETRLEGGILRVSIKTVNHRYLNTSLRTPPGFDRFDGSAVDLDPALHRTFFFWHIKYYRDYHAGFKDKIIPRIVAFVDQRQRYNNRRRRRRRVLRPRTPGRPARGRAW